MQSWQGRQRFRFAQTLLQRGAEEMVVPEPAALVVQRHDKQPGQLQMAQRGVPDFCLHDCITQLWTHAVQDGRAEQERLDVRRLALQHFFEQVVQHQAVASGEGLDEPVRVTLPRQGHGRHLQACWPAFGARVQCLNLGLGQSERHRSVQKETGLLCTKAQVVLTDLQQLALGTQPGQGDGRHLA